MLDYIFNNLKTTEKSLRQVNKTLTVQRDLNRLFTVAAVASLVRFAAIKNYIRKQDKEIKELRKEIEELKNEKGE